MFDSSEHGTAPLPSGGSRSVLGASSFRLRDCPFRRLHTFHLLRPARSYSRSREGWFEKRRKPCPTSSGVPRQGSPSAPFRIEAASPLKRRSQCLSRVRGNLHARFLEGWAPAMGPGYSVRDSHPLDFIEWFPLFHFWFLHSHAYPSARNRKLGDGLPRGQFKLTRTLNQEVWLLSQSHPQNC